jgi:hypothetical protein
VKGNRRITFEQWGNRLLIGTLNRLFHQGVLDDTVLHTRGPKTVTQVGYTTYIKSLKVSHHDGWDTFKIMPESLDDRCFISSVQFD